MIVVYVNPNAVYIPTIQPEDVKLGFDSAYPIHLNGIISQDEFRESIYRINRIVTANDSSKVCLGILTTSFIVGLIFMVVGKATASSSSTSQSPHLFGIGIAIIVLGSILAGVCSDTISGSITRTRQAINKESVKYLSRFPTPCSWRLDTMRQYGNDRDGKLVYHLVIEIGRSDVPGNGTDYSNQAAAELTVFVAEQDDSAPPPYSNQAAGFCSQCSAPQQAITARFCSSCGHSFNKE